MNDHESEVDPLAVWRSRRRGRSFGQIYLIVSLVVLVGAVAFLGGFNYGVFKQRTAPTVRAR